jgi:dolichol-phosphate mannosyltransferase
MVAYTRSKLRHLLKIEFVRFCIVGGTGFVINFIILTILHRLLNFPVFIAQLIGAEIALFSNFMMHHHWTYKAHKVEKTITKLVIQFHATTWPAILGSALMVTGGEKILHLDNLLALAVSSIIALLWNFVWSKYVVWRNITPLEVEKIAK